MNIDLALLIGRYVEFERPEPYAGRYIGKVVQVFPAKGQVRIELPGKRWPERVGISRIVGVVWFKKIRPLEEWLRKRSK